ncbi:GH32 C-terminal domain-containing protein [Spiroplasma tabanidicola]|uniref:beta-fructofuranosidase n=1 Tax=Spiroplasma tabanidicola TaxID=324079 RepID=A0A6I6CE81_9MOLU|nr:GH32 C-terminal domain-containing protein [Spiroplasma tabanidicola]QGS52284.1 beta-fructofuranosidase [Spiroplasma tabanidicola]
MAEQINRYKKITEYSNDEIDKVNEIVKYSLYYPYFHISPFNGLMNDPNGLFYKDGYFYIHYQNHPMRAIHGLKYWYLVKTKDFVHYIDCGYSNSPELKEENHGCFSGSAYLENNQIKIIYTGNEKDENAIRTQHQIVGDLIDNKIVNKKVVVKHDNKISTEHIRDPKIIYANDKQYMIVGAQTLEKKGTIAVFEKVKDNWVFKSYIKLKQLKDPGYMWECPNIEKVDGMYVVMFSIQGVNNTDKYNLQNSSNVISIVCSDIDFENGDLIDEQPFEMFDHGQDLYATQTFWYEEKLLAISWVGTLDVEYPSDKDYWTGSLSIPVELNIKNNKLEKKPFNFFEKNILENDLKSEKTKLIKSLNLPARISLSTNENVIKIKNEKNEYICLEIKKDEVIFDRSKQSLKIKSNFGDFRYIKNNNKLKQVDIWIDNSIIEVFVDNQLLTSKFFVIGDLNLELQKEVELKTNKIKKISYTK